MMSYYDQMKLAKQIHKERVRKGRMRVKAEVPAAPIDRHAIRRAGAGCPYRAAC
jgi:hypothetical protein